MPVPIFLFLALVLPFDWLSIGPERGSVTAIAVHERSLTAGTAEGRLFRWDGDSWEADGDYGDRIEVIVPTDGGVWVLAGTRLYRSRSLALSGVTSFAIAPANQDTVYAATREAIFFSDDGGTSWMSVDRGAVSIAVDAASTEQLWAVRESGDLEKSSDGGRTWARSSLDATIRRVEAHPRRAGVAYAIAADGRGFRTDGNAWTELYYLTGRLIFDPRRDDHFYAVDHAGRLFHSDDDGDWLDTIHGGPVLSLAYGADGTILAGFLDEGIQRSDDGGHTWASQSRGLIASEIESLAASPDGRTIFAGTGRTMMRSTDGGTSWIPIFLLRLLPGPFSDIAIDPLDPKRVWIAAGVSAWYSSDGGDHFNRLFWLPANEPQTITAIEFDPADSRTILVAMSQSFFRLDSDPLHLTELTPPRETGDRYDVLLTERTGAIWIGGERYGRALLLRSLDGGETWTNVASAVQAGPITSLHSATGAVLAGTADGSVLRTADNGSTWHRHATLMGPVRSIASTGSLLLFAAKGIYLSDGTALHRASGSIGSQAVTTLTSTTPVFAGTAAEGVFVQHRVETRRRSVRH